MYTVGDKVLISFIIVGVVATLVVNIAPLVRPPRDDEEWKPTDAKIVMVTSEMTRCENCVNKYVPELVEDDNSRSGSHDDDDDDDDYEERHLRDEAERKRNNCTREEWKERMKMDAMGALGAPHDGAGMGEMGAPHEGAGMGEMGEHHEGMGEDHDGRPEGEHHEGMPEGEHHEGMPEGEHHEGMPEHWEGRRRKRSDMDSDPRPEIHPREPEHRPETRPMEQKPELNIPENWESWTEVEQAAWKEKMTADMSQYEHLINPDWWTKYDLDEATWKKLKENCPEIPAWYVVVEYLVGDVVESALAHNNIEELEAFPHHSFSTCQMDERKERNQYHHGERHQRERRQLKPISQSNLATELLRNSLDQITVFVDPTDKEHVVTTEPDNYHGMGRWMRRRCVGAFPILVTIILIIVLVVRRCKRHKRQQRIDDITKKSVYDCGPVVEAPAPVVISHMPTDAEKDPAALGPEVSPNAPPYDVTILSGKTLMMSGLSGDVTSKDNVFGSFDEAMKMEEAAMPPVYESPATPPPNYTSTVDLSKY